MKLSLLSLYLIVISSLSALALPGKSSQNVDLSLQDSSVVFSIDTLTAENGELICMQLSTENFEDVILMEMSILYDAEVLRYINAAVLTDLLPGFNESTFSTPETNGSGNKFIISWLDNDLNGQNILQKTDIFEMCFEVIGEPGDKSVLNIDQIEVADTANELVNAEDRDGLVCVKMGVYSQEIEQMESLYFYPNPTDGAVRFNHPVKSFSIWNNEGVKMMEREGAPEREFNLRSLPAGNYWLLSGTSSLPLRISR